MQSINWDDLRYCLAVAREGSVTAAARKLAVNHTTVSRRISALEQELTVPLFHRHARGLILTEQGELLFRTAHDVFMQLQAARAKLTDSRERPSGDLKISTTPGLGINWLTPRLGEFTALYPDIRITLVLTDDELDLACEVNDRPLGVDLDVKPQRLLDRGLLGRKPARFEGPPHQLVVDLHVRPHAVLLVYQFYHFVCTAAVSAPRRARCAVLGRVRPDEDPRINRGPV